MSLLGYTIKMCDENFDYRSVYMFNHCVCVYACMCVCVRACVCTYLYVTLNNKSIYVDF